MKEKYPMEQVCLFRLHFLYGEGKLRGIIPIRNRLIPYPALFVLCFYLIFSTLLINIPLPANADTFVSGMSLPTGLAIHPSERLLYVKGGNGGTIWKIPINSNGQAGTISTVTDQFNSYLDIKFDAAGNLYGAGSGQITKMDSSGKVYKCTTYKFGMNENASPLAIAIETPQLSSSRLFFQSKKNSSYNYIYSTLLSELRANNDYNNNDIGYLCGEMRFLIYRQDRNDLVGSWGGSVSSINTGNGTCTTLISNLVQPTGLAEDSSGNLYIADTGTGKIIKRTPLGTIEDFVTNLDSPTGLVYDETTDMLFVSETDANKVTTIDLNSPPVTDCDYTQADVENARNEAVEKCKTNPASCGITISGGFTQADIDAAEKEAIQKCKDNPASCGISVSGSSTPATISPDLDVHIPELKYTTPFGAMSLWIDFEYVGESKGDLLWKLSDFGQK